MIVSRWGLSELHDAGTNRAAFGTHTHIDSRSGSARARGAVLGSCSMRDHYRDRRPRARASFVARDRR